MSAWLGPALGPFDSEAQARAAAQAAADPGMAPLKPAGNRKLLDRVCEEAGVTLGGWDEQILDWLAIWEPSTVVVVAGWIGRAYEAGQKAATSPGGRP